jgi:hypothetical protein
MPPLLNGNVASTDDVAVVAADAGANGASDDDDDDDLVRVRTDVVVVVVEAGSSHRRVDVVTAVAVAPLEAPLFLMPINRSISFCDGSSNRNCCCLSAPAVDTCDVGGSR